MPWVKGVSGNPGGREQKNPEIKAANDLARQNCPKAMQKLVDLMDSENEQMQYAAANTIVNRVLGMAKQTVGVEGSVVHYVARIPAVVEKTSVWIAEAQNQLLSGSPKTDPKHGSLPAPSLKLVSVGPVVAEKQTES